MRNAGLEESQAGIKIARKNLNNLRYADDTTLMAEREEKLKSLLMKMKEESERVGLKLNIQKMKIISSGPITSWQVFGEAMETMTDFLLGVSKITAESNCSHEIKRCLLPEKKVDAIQPSHPLFPLFLPPSIFPSIRVFSSESALHISWPKYWSFSFSISPSSEHSGLMSFRMDWLDLLAVQGTLKSSSTPQLKSISSSTLSFLSFLKLSHKKAPLTPHTKTVGA